MEPIRILQMSGAMNRGGAETLIMELYRHLDRSKVQFDFMVYNYTGKPAAYDEEIQKLGGRIYEMKKRFYHGPVSYWREAKDFFDLHTEYRLVHAHQYATSGYILSAAKKSDKRRITITHSHIAFPQTDILRKFADWGGKKLLNKYADYYFGCSEDALLALAGRPADGEKLFVLKNAITPEKFVYHDESRNKWRAFFEATENTLIVGNVARHTYQKNHEHILLTFNEIVEKKEDSILVLIGVGGKTEEIKEMTKKLGLTNKVYFMGSRPDVNEIMNAFDVFLLPSRYEGLGIVLIEAQANGLHCVISSDVIPEEADVHGGMVTRLSLDEDPREWAEACLQVQGRTDAKNAQQAVIRAGYDIETVASWLQEFYLRNWRD